MFRVKNKLFILLHVSLVLFFLGCEINNKNQNYTSNSSHKEVLIFPKETKTTQKEEEKSNPLFVNESLINKAKVQDIEAGNESIISKWWILAIVLSIFIVVYSIRLLMKKQQIILEKLQKRSE